VHNNLRGSGNLVTPSHKDPASPSSESDVELDLNTPLCFHGLTPDQPSVDQDLSNLDGGHITLRHEIRKLFLASDLFSLHDLDSKP
jgi:hypothetical protein